MAGQTSSIKFEQIFLNGLFSLNLDDVGTNDERDDVEITKNYIIDTFIDIVKLDEPDPAIVALKEQERIQETQTGLVW